MNVELIRFAYLPNATLGWLKAGTLKLATLEEPWRRDPDGPGGQRREGDVIESCVEDGFYNLVPHDSARFPKVYALVGPTHGVYRWPGDIPPGQKYGRSAILIHAGNSTKDIMGCIAVGMEHTTHSGAPFVTNSRAAMDKLRDVLGLESHTLVICPTVGTNEAA
jgi:hypothetical protein